MRVAFLVTEFPSVSTTFILNQIVGLLERGHEVEILATRRGRTDPMHDDIRRHGLLDRTTWTEMPSSHGRRAIEATTGVLSRIHRLPRALLRSLDVRRYGPMAASGALLFGALRLRERRCFDVIHCHFATNGLRGLYYRDAGLLTGALVTSFHGYDVNVFPEQYGRSVYRSLFARGDLFMANTSFILERAAALGCPRERSVRLPMGVDLSRFAYRERQARADEPIRIVAAGRLVAVKGFEDLLHAIALVRRRHPRVRLEILGEGPLRARLENVTRELGLAEVVAFAGAVREDELRRRLGGAHLFAMACARTEDGSEEGQGLVFAEAQACGLPVIATRSGGIPESVADGESGFLVPEHDVEALAERIGWLVEHPEAWGAMGRAGRRWVEACYDRHRLDDDLVGLYERAIARARHA